MRAKDSLFIGMARPPMIAGVTFLYMGLNAFGVALMFVLTKNFLALAAFVPIHAVGYLICMKDPQLLDVMLKGLQKNAGVSNKKFWSGRSYER